MRTIPATTMAVNATTVTTIRELKQETVLGHGQQLEVISKLKVM